MGKNRVSELGSLDPTGEHPKQLLGGANGDNGHSEGTTGGAGGGIDRDVDLSCAPPSSPGPGSSFVEGLRQKDAKRRCLPPTDEATEARAPFLWEMLTLDIYADGSTRFLPEIVIRRASGVYEISIRDHATRQRKQGAALTLDSLVDALEALLCDPTRPWLVYDSWMNPDPEMKKDARSKKA